MALLKGSWALGVSRGFHFLQPAAGTSVQPSHEPPPERKKKRYLHRGGEKNWLNETLREMLCEEKLHLSQSYSWHEWSSELLGMCAQANLRPLALMALFVVNSPNCISHTLLVAMASWLPQPDLYSKFLKMYTERDTLTKLQSCTLHSNSVQNWNLWVGGWEGQ